MESNLQPNPAPLVQTQTPPKKLSGWGSLMGVLLIVNGAFTSMTIILAIIGIPLIIAGVKLLKAISLSQEITTGDPTTNEVFDNLNSFFKINGIVFICTIVLSIIGFTIMMAFGLFALIQGANNL